jgi:surface polysaccharide O-acyltransferase-like enzyme
MESVKPVFQNGANKSYHQAKQVSMIAGIDAFKFVFSIFVVGIHTHPFEQSTETAKSVVGFFFNMAVPFFFISSSYLLFSKPIDDSSERRRNINRYALKMVKLYAAWTIIYLPVTFYDYWGNGKTVAHNAASFFRMLVMVGEHFFSWPLWYLLASIYGIIIMKLLVNRKFVMPIFAFLLLLLSEFLTRLSRGEISFVPHSQDVAGVIHCTISDGRILSALPYFVAGYYLSRPLDRHVVLKLYVLGGIGSALCMLKMPYISTISMLPVCAAVFLAAKNIKFRPSAKYAKLRRASTVIYFTHMYFYFAVSLIVHDFNWHGWMPFVVVTCCSLAFSLLVIKTERKIGMLKFIFG